MKNDTATTSGTGTGTTAAFTNPTNPATTTPSSDLVEVPYKEPFIQMFEDIMAGLVRDDFTVENLVNFFMIASEVTEEDSNDCKSSEVREVADFTKTVYTKLQEMILNNSSYKEIKEYSFYKSRHTKKLFDELPDEFICQVEGNSNIVTRRDLKPPYETRLNYNVSTMLPSSYSSLEYSSIWSFTSTESSPQQSSTTNTTIKTTTTTTTTTTATTTTTSSSYSSSSSSSSFAKKKTKNPKYQPKHQEQTTTTTTITTTTSMITTMITTTGESSILP